MTFREFELRGWERAAAAYDRLLGEITARTSEPLLDDAGVKKGSVVLDVATGPGQVAEAARARGARAVGLDFSWEMLRLSKGERAGGDAEALPFLSGEFDAAVANFGIVHFAHPEKAARELARVVKPGGRVALTAWAPPGENPFFGGVYAALEAHAKKPDVPAGPAFFQFGNDASFAKLLEGAGLVDAKVRRVSWKASVASAEALVGLFVEATVRTGAILKAQDAATISKIIAAVDLSLQPHRVGGKFQVPIVAVLASGRKN